MLTTRKTPERDTAGHEGSLGDDNRDNVEADRRHEAPQLHRRYDYTSE